MNPETLLRIIENLLENDSNAALQAFTSWLILVLLGWVIRTLRSIQEEMKASRIQQDDRWQELSARVTRVENVRQTPARRHA